MFLFDDLQFYKNKNCRSSNYVISLWENFIEHEVILHLGMRKNLMISIFIDYDTLFLTITSDYNVIQTKNCSINIKHVISTFEELTATIDITINKSNNFLVDYSLCSFFFDKKNKKDEGSIEIDCFVKTNIKNYIDFKANLLSNLSREYQYAIQSNALKEDINKTVMCYIDAEFEYIFSYSKIKQIDFDEALNLLKEKCSLSDIEIKYIRKINKII